jgi:hypothetical protein
MFEKNKEKLISLNDELKGSTIVLMQIYPSMNVDNLIFDSLMAKQQFKFNEFFNYIFGIYLADFLKFIFKSFFYRCENY